MSPTAVRPIFRLADKAFGRSEKMEELHRLHKEVPFGWVALLQELFAERRAAGKTSVKAAPIARTAFQPSDLHHLAGPH